MKVFLVRHGESEANVGKSHGTPSTSLSKLGVRQAKIVAQRLLDVDPDLIITSKYVRAIDTGRVISKALGKKLIQTPLLNEWRTPTELQMVERGSKKDMEVWDEIERFRDNPEWHYSDEENAFDVVKRAGKAIRYLSSRKEKQIVVVTHGAFIKAILQFAILGANANPTEFFRIIELFDTNNTGITELRVEDGEVKKIITFNDHAHLQ